MNKREFLTLLGAGAMAGVPNVARAQESPVMRLGTLLSDSSAEPLYGVDSGIYAQAGLHLELQPFTNYGTMQGALAGGAIDIALLDVVAIAIGVSHGIPFQIICPGQLQNARTPTMTLLVAKNSPYKHPKDLEGQTIAVSSLKGSAEAVMRAWLSKEGVDNAKVGLVEIAYSQMGPALERGTVAAAEIAEPSMTTTRLAGARIVGRVYDAIGQYFYANAFTVNAPYLQTHESLLKKFVAATYKTALWANANHDLTGPILTKYAKIDPASVASITRAQYATSFALPLLQPLMDAGIKSGVLPATVTTASLVAPAFR